MFGSVVVHSFGPPDAEVAILGQSPGQEEEVLGRPFVGPAGRFARRAFEEAGYDWEKVYRLNVFERRLLRVSDREALKREIVRERGRIEEEINRLKGLRLLFAAGNEAIYAVSGRWGALYAHGDTLRRVIYIPDGVRVVAIVHPSFVLRSGGESSRWYGRLVEVLKRERQLLPVLSRS